MLFKISIYLPGSVAIKERDDASFSYISDYFPSILIFIFGKSVDLDFFFLVLCLSHAQNKLQTHTIFKDGA